MKKLLAIALCVVSFAATAGEVKWLFSMSGTGIAFTDGSKYVFDKDGNWCGWFGWGDNDVADTKGQYLGTVVGDRLVRLPRGYKGYPGYPGYPGYAGYPGYSGYGGYESVAGAAEVIIVPQNQR